MPRRCGSDGNCGPRTNWWKQSMGVDWYAESSKETFNPLNLNPDLWIDGTSKDYFVSSVDNLGNIVDVLTTRDANAYASVPESSGALFKKPTFNGEGLYFNALGIFRLGTVSSFNRFHNGNAWTMYLSWYYIPQTESATPRHILSTNGTPTTNTQRGIKISNLNSAINPHTMKVSMYNGTGGVSGPFDVTCSNNSLVQNQYNEIKIVFTGSALTVYIRNSSNPIFTQIGTDASGSGLSSSDAASTMAIGVEGTTGFSGYLKHIIGWYRNLTIDETNDIESWLAEQTSQVITPTHVNVYFWWGQSNAWGIALNSEANVAIQGRVGSYIFYPPNLVYTNKQDYWAELELGVTSNPQILTQHGYHMRFGQRMAANGTPCYLIGQGRGSTQLIDAAASVDWHATTPWSVGDQYPIFRDNVTADGLEKLLHVMRKIPVLRGCFKLQGENDASLADASAYATTLDNFIKAFIDDLITKGYDTSKIRWMDMQVISAGPQESVVNAAIADVDNFLIREPTYSTKIKSTTHIDGRIYDANDNHYNAQGFFDMADDILDYYIQFVNE